MITRSNMVTLFITLSLLLARFMIGEAHAQTRLGTNQNIVAFDGKVDDAAVVQEALAQLAQKKTVHVFTGTEGCTGDDRRYSAGVDLWNILGALDAKKLSKKPGVDADADEPPGEGGKAPPVDEVADWNEEI